MHLVQSMAYVNETPWHGLGNHLAAIYLTAPRGHFPGGNCQSEEIPPVVPPHAPGFRRASSDDIGIKKPAKPYAITGFWISEDDLGQLIGAGCRTRTRHLMITNQLLYLMS